MFASVVSRASAISAYGRPTTSRKSSAIFRSTLSAPIARQTISISSMGRDRKSTPLNSSHVKISYAVFCLKKKKKKNTLIPLQKKNHEDKNTKQETKLT